MDKVHVRETLDAPIEVVWKLVGDFGNISAYALGTVVKLEGSNGIGMVRHVDGPAGRFVERCEAYDAAEHAFTYRLLQCPLPAANFVANVRLTAAAPNKTIIEWAAEFDASAPDLRERIENAYRNVFIGNIRRNLAKTSSNG